jgi:hypothetical protein
MSSTTYPWFAPADAATASATAVTSTWPCCSHCSCDAKHGHDRACGQVDCPASSSDLVRPVVRARVPQQRRPSSSW